MECRFIPANAKSGLIPLQDLLQIAIRDGRAIIPIAGDCMEGADIMDGGRVAVDFTHYPRPGRQEDGKYIPGDPCVCFAAFPSGDIDAPPPKPVVMCKQYDGVWIGHMVGTKYKQKPGEPYRMNSGFTAHAILGVVYASWSPDGELLWETDPEEYPTELPTKTTVKGGNIKVEGAIVRV